MSVGLSCLCRTLHVVNASLTIDRIWAGFPKNLCLIFLLSMIHLLRIKRATVLTGPTCVCNVYANNHVFEKGNLCQINHRNTNIKIMYWDVENFMTFSLCLVFKCIFRNYWLSLENKLPVLGMVLACINYSTEVLRLFCLLPCISWWTLYQQGIPNNTSLTPFKNKMTILQNNIKQRRIGSANHSTVLRTCEINAIWMC